MKKIGLVGGISWVSTMDYYRLVNEGINKKLGGLNSAELLIYSLNFGEVQSKTWEGAYDLLLGACKALKNGGADAIALGANTAHLYLDELKSEINLPFIDIICETAKCIEDSGLKKVGLLGTKFTMEKDFYREQLEKSGIEVLIPPHPETRAYIQQVLKEELGIGEVKRSRPRFLQIANELIDQGAEGVILGCTEIPLLICQHDVSFPVFDTTKIHAEAIVEYAVNTI